MSYLDILKDGAPVSGGVTPASEKSNNTTTAAVLDGATTTGGGEVTVCLGADPSLL